MEIPLSDLEELRDKIYSLKTSIESFVLTNELKRANISDKVGVLHARLQSIHDFLKRSSKWRQALIEPYLLERQGEIGNLCSFFS